MRTLRSLGALLAVALVTAGSVSATASPAGALVVNQLCTGTWAVTYDPPITNTPQLVTGNLSGFFPVCTDTQAFNASYFQTFTDTVSCTTLLNAGTASRTFVWGNPAAQPSTFSYNWTVTVAGGQSVITNAGSITSGRYTPDSAVQVATIGTPDALQCATTGIASLTGPSTLTIAGP
jgi:hypothetical protein